MGEAAAPVLGKYLDRLCRHFAGQINPDTWWPARSRFEVVAGAILVQNTAWENAQRALASLRAARRLSVAGIVATAQPELETLIRSAGCWRQKARRLGGVAAWITRQYGGSVHRMLGQPTANLRAELLEQDGIGEETADAILLYAGEHMSFVLDAYTRRIFERHRLPAERAWIESQVEATPRAYRHWHALLVETGKRYCGKRATDCAACPLQPLLPRTAEAGTA